MAKPDLFIKAFLLKCEENGLKYLVVVQFLGLQLAIKKKKSESNTYVITVRCSVHHKSQMLF